MKEKVNFAFFGTDPLAESILNELLKNGMIPSLVVSGPSKQTSRDNFVYPIEHQWAEKHNVKIESPTKITEEFIGKLKTSKWDLFIVASYGKILPKELLDIPSLGTINVHPSLLPKLRGPSPIRSALLNNERDTGVSIMILDEKMDHGPLLAQEKIDIKEWPIPGLMLDKILADAGAKLLVETLPKYIAGEIKPSPQDHTEATFCKNFNKADGLIDLHDDSYKNFLKVCAFDGWPGTFFFAQKKDKQIRVKIVSANYKDGKMIIKRVVPEGKKEMDYESFLRGL